MGCSKDNALVQTQEANDKYIDGVAKTGNIAINNVEEFMNSLFHITDLASGLSWTKNISTPGMSYKNASDFVKATTNEKFKTVKELLKDGTKDEIAYVRERGFKLMAYIATNADPAFTSQIKHNNKISKASINLFNFYRNTNKNLANTWGIGGGVWIPLGGEKRFELLSNFPRVVRQSESLGKIYQLMNTTGASASALMPKYIRATQGIMDQFAKGVVTSDMIDKYAYLTDLNQMGWKGGKEERQQFEVSAKDILTKRLADEDDIKSPEDISAVWETLREFKKQWNGLNYGFEDPYDIDGKGTKITKKILLDNAILSRSITVNGVSVPPLLHTILFLGNNLATIAKSAGNDVEARRILSLFDSNLNDDQGFQFRREYIPTAGNDGIDQLISETSRVPKLGASPELLHARQENKNNQVKRLSDNIIGIAKSFNEFISTRTEYLGMRAMSELVENDKENLIKNNRGMYNAVKSYTDKMLEDYEQFNEPKEISSFTQYLKRFGYGLLGLQAGVLLTGSAPTNLVAGYLSSSMDMPMMFGPESQRSLRGRYNEALQGQGIDRVIAEVNQGEYKFHLNTEKVSEMIVKDSNTTLNNSKAAMYRQLGLSIDDPNRKTLFGKFMDKIDALPDGMTRTGEALINRMAFMSESLSFNKSENHLLKIGEAYSFDQTKKAMSFWVTEQTRNGKSPTDEDIRKKTAEFVQSFSLDSFNLAKSSMGDFSKYSKPMWAWHALKNADTSWKVLAGTILTSMYMFKGVFAVNAEVIGKMLSSGLGRAKNIGRPSNMRIGTVAIGGAGGTVLALMALGMYQLAAELVRKDEDDNIVVSTRGDKFLPSLSLANRATPFQPVISNARMAMDGYGMLANATGNGDTSEEYGAEAANFLSYTFGTLLGGSFREGYNERYENILNAMADVATRVKFKFDFGLGYMKAAMSGLFTEAEQGHEWDYLREMNKSADNFIIFNNSNDVQKLTSTMLFGVNQMYNYFQSGDKKFINNAVNTVTNEVKYQTGFYIPMKYESKKYNDWELTNMIRKADAAGRVSERRYGYKSYNYAANQSKYALEKYIYGLNRVQKLNYYTLQRGFESVSKGRNPQYGY